jgi:hypothetical protein
MSRSFQILLLTISASLGMAAQTYRITPVVTSASVIGGQDMHACFAPGSAALNDAGEVAFALTCHTGDLKINNMVVTAHRIVASDKELVDGKTVKIFSDDPIAINSRGQVAYVVIYYAGNDLKKDVDDETKWHTAICVDNHIVTNVPDKTSINSLNLADDGTVSFNQPLTPHAAASPTGQRVQALHQIPIKLPPLKLPKNVPIGIPPSNPQLPAPTPTANPLPPFSTNSHGQILINSKFNDFGFVILLATPAN